MISRQAHTDDITKPLSTTQKFADDRITENAQEILYRSQELDATGIELTVYDGVIHLSGNVRDVQAIQLCGNCLKGIKGLKGIENELEVRPLDKSKLS